MNSSLLVRLFDLLARLPLPVLHRLGVLLGWVSYYISGTYANRMRENLGYYNTSRHPSEFRRVLRASVGEAGKSITELPWVWRRPVPEVLARVGQCYGREYLDAAMLSGKGVIVLTPHMGCFEIIGLYIAAETPMTCMYSTPKQAWMDELIRGGRQRGKMLLARADIGGVRTLLKALKRGEVIGLLPDQVPAHGDGEWVDFFGRQAYTMTLVGRLQEASGAKVLLSHVVRKQHGEGYEIHFSPLDLYAGKSVPRQINTALEQVIRTCPSQYLWSYNRYKAPPGSMPSTESKE